MGAVDTGTERGLPMEERKPDKKPIIWYWAIAIVIFLLLNMFVFPRVMQHNVKEVGYDTFISMMENKEIGSVEVESSQITFTNKDETGRIPFIIDKINARINFALHILQINLIV